VSSASLEEVFVKRRTVLSLPLLTVAANSLQADPAHGDPRLEKLFTTFMAPCCWRGNLLVHQSPKAQELREEIVKLISAGKSDEQIKAAYVQQYSTRILAMPEGTPGQMLSWAPALATGGGVAAVAWAMQRMRGTAPAPETLAAPATLPPLPEIDE